MPETAASVAEVRDSEAISSQKRSSAIIVPLDAPALFLCELVHPLLLSCVNLVRDASARGCHPRRCQRRRPLALNGTNDACEADNAEVVRAGQRLGVCTHEATSQGAVAAPDAGNDVVWQRARCVRRNPRRRERPQHGLVGVEVLMQQRRQRGLRRRHA
ncbi:hypothetical protein U9M48_001493 [Paspalum notatum var. saurae]|uniref:Uncharacterized protein n=1 Tax=Paspalum notatum var. saurae TaxID=547442 RepID=A0AAQ3PM44_PASNO